MLFSTLKSGARSFFDRFMQQRRGPAAYPLEEERELGRASARRHFDFFRDDRFLP